MKMKISFIFTFVFVLFNVLEQRSTKYLLVEVEGNDSTFRDYAEIETESNATESNATEMENPEDTILAIGDVCMIEVVLGKCPEGSKCGSAQCTVDSCRLTCISVNKYSTPPALGECVLNDDGGIGMHPPHERCNCKDSEPPLCKENCDSDGACKGYAEMTKETTGCHIATTSKCPKGCKREHKSRVGELKASGGPEIKADKPSSWLCFIKTREIPPKPFGKGSVFPDEKGKEPIEKKGTHLIPLQRNLNESLGFNVVGTTVTNITSGSTAAKNNLKIGDLIVAVNQKNVTNNQELVTSVQASGPSVNLSVYRDVALVAYECWWIGTSPFCSPDECESGSKQVSMDNRGDGVACVTGFKRKCCKPEGGNPNGHRGGSGEGGGSGEPEEPEEPEGPEENGGDEDDEEDNPIGDNDYGYPL